MSLAHAILGLLRDRSMTGYDLKITCFDGSIAHFWPADQAQIYRTLDKLADQGFIESHVEIQQDRPNRKVYSITEVGRVELDRWLHSFQMPPAHREPFLVQLFFADQLERETVIRQLEQQIAAHVEQLAIYERIGISAPNEISDPAIQRMIMFQKMTLDLGIRTEKNYVAWLNHCLEMVRGMP